jgi:hypothetical protein
VPTSAPGLTDRLCAHLRRDLAGKRLTRELRYGTVAWNVWTALTCAADLCRATQRNATLRNAAQRSAAQRSAAAGECETLCGTMGAGSAERRAGRVRSRNRAACRMPCGTARPGPARHGPARHGTLLARTRARVLGLGSMRSRRRPQSYSVHRTKGCSHSSVLFRVGRCSDSSQPLPGLPSARTRALCRAVPCRQVPAAHVHVGRVPGRAARERRVWDRRRRERAALRPRAGARACLQLCAAADRVNPRGAVTHAPPPPPPPLGGRHAWVKR